MITDKLEGELKSIVDEAIDTDSLEHLAEWECGLDGNQDRQKMLVEMFAELISKVIEAEKAEKIRQLDMEEALFTLHASLKYEQKASKAQAELLHAATKEIKRLRPLSFERALLSNHS